MFKYSLLIFSFLILIFIKYSHAEKKPSANIICPGDPPSIQCFKNNFDELAMQNHKRFWDIYHYYSKQAEQCKDEKITSSFLDVAYYIKGNSEATEAFADFSEKLFLTSPKCYLNSALLLDDNSLSWLVFFYLTQPVYHDSKQIDKIMDQYKNDNKYIRITQRYYKRSLPDSLKIIRDSDYEKD